ncbi:MAG: Spy/CpxP family protein refolding chaperone [Bdellovibrionales bacterium]|nr:Spy/CpxP family protein refolding chaperone [Bdellovibrionales bacterium]
MRLQLPILMVFFLMTPAPVAYAQPGGKKGVMRKVLKELNLSDEQKSSLKEMRKANKGQMKELRQQKKAARLELKEAMGSDASESKLRALHTKLQELRKETATKRFENLLKIRKVLTPKQRKKFVELRASKRGRNN